MVNIMQEIYTKYNIVIIIERFIDSMKTINGYIYIYNLQMYDIYIYN